MIKPTVGRIVWYYENDAQVEPYAAIVMSVGGDHTVDLVVFDPCGLIRQHYDVLLLQDDGEAPTGWAYAEWMPFQKGQAAKTEVAEAKVAA